jgi:hypothetical protein
VRRERGGRELGVSQRSPSALAAITRRPSSHAAVTRTAVARPSPASRRRERSA